MTTRRTFLKLLGAVPGIAALLPATMAHAKKVALKVASAPGVDKVGGAALVKIKGLDVLLIRDSETSVHAVNAVCTHKHCKVRYDTELKHIKCKCHKSQYTLDGKNVSGPSKKPLTKYEAKLDGERIILDLGDDAK